MPLLVAGRVQGVGFRWSVQREAQRVGARGWVRNLADGRVEAFVEGDREAVDAVVAFCRRGPDNAVVDAVEVSEQDAREIGEFDIR